MTFFWENLLLGSHKIFHQHCKVQDIHRFSEEKSTMHCHIIVQRPNTHFIRSRMEKSRTYFHRQEFNISRGKKLELPVSASSLTSASRWMPWFNVTCKPNLRDSISIKVDAAIKVYWVSSFCLRWTLNNKCWFVGTICSFISISIRPSCFHLQCHRLFHSRKRTTL